MFGDHFLKQASDATGVNISDLRQPPNDETQTSRVHNMLRPKEFEEESFETFHQGSKPTQFEEESFETLHQGSKPTQFFDFREDVNTSVATAGYDNRVERQRVLAEHALSQRQTRAQESIDLARRQAE